MRPEDDARPVYIEKQKPLTPLDWVLLVVLLVLFVLSFPYLWRIYRFLIPMALVGLLLYFAVRIFDIGKQSSDNASTVLSIWIDFKNFIRIYFRGIVIAKIIAIVLAVSAILWYTNYAKQGDAVKKIQRISFALEKHKASMGTYPASLVELVGNDPLKKEWLLDSWGNSIEYTSTKNGGYQISSAGADGAKGSADDIKVEK